MSDDQQQPPPRSTGVPNQLVFVTGLHRSGTSLLFRCLRDHPHISGFSKTGVPEDEGQHLQSVIPTARHFGGPGRFGFDPAAYLDEQSPLARPASADKMMAEWAPYWDLSRPILIEKTPPTLIRTRFFQALFPEAKFVVVLRHPLAVAYATYKWKGWTVRKRDGLSLGRLIEHWLITHERFAADVGHLQQVKVILYEHLVAQPDDIFAQLYEFLGVEPAAQRQEIRSNINDSYFQRWQNLQNHPLKFPYAAALIRRYEKRVQPFGYSLTDLSLAQRPPFLAVKGT